MPSPNFTNIAITRETYALLVKLNEKTYIPKAKLIELALRDYLTKIEEKK